MERPIAPPGEATYSVPSTPSIPERWDETTLLRVTKDLRRRLLQTTARIKTSDSRREWLLHQILQSHELKEMLELVEMFNVSQKRDTGLGFDVINLELHDLGAHLTTRSESI
jgi:hypothetical protein